MAVPVDNVIMFPDGVRDSTPDFGRSQTLVKARDLMAQELREAFRSLLPTLVEELLARGDVALGRSDRELFYGTRDLIRGKALRLEGVLVAKWLELCRQELHPADKSKLARSIDDAGELQLLDFGAIDQELAVKAIAARLRGDCDENLFGAGRRLASLSGQAEGNWPLEDFIARSLDMAFLDAGVVGMARVELLRAIERHAVEAFGTPIRRLNDFLIGRGVLPKLRRSYTPPATDKKQSDHAESVAETADIFALLQGLVTAHPVNGTANGAGNAVGSPMSRGIGELATGLSRLEVSPGQMPVAMEQVMSSLHSLQRVAPIQAAGQSLVNVLREFRASDTGQSLEHLHAVTVDIVATLFDFIFGDDSISDPLKVLVARLQIPVLKVAMLDRTFFSSRAHPARRLLEGISRAAVRCGPEAGHGDPLYACIAEIIDRLQKEFTQDTSLFDLLCVELNTFLDGQEAAADARAVQAAPLVTQQERRELASLAADEAIAPWLTMALPPVVTDLLNQEWRMLLIREHLSGDEAAWGVAMSTMSDLVASVQPQSDVHSRRCLAARLPTLVRRIHVCLEDLKVADERRLALIDKLFTLHAGVLRGAVPLVTDSRLHLPEADPVPVRITSERVECGETHLERIFLSPGALPPPSLHSNHAQSSVARLQRGDWLEFSNAEKGPLRFRLSWVSPQRGILLLTSPQSPQAMSVSPEALALQIERGEASILAVEPIFDRAVRNALETLKAA